MTASTVKQFAEIYVRLYMEFDDHADYEKKVKKMLRAGQSAVFMAACHMLGGSRKKIPLNDIINFIVENFMWGNHDGKKHGIGSIHSCEGHRMYKFKGKFITEYEPELQKKIIYNVLRGNVLNRTNMQETSTRLRECSVIVNRWLRRDYEDGVEYYYF